MEGSSIYTPSEFMTDNDADANWEQAQVNAAANAAAIAKARAAGNDSELMGGRASRRRSHKNRHARKSKKSRKSRKSRS